MKFREDKIKSDRTGLFNNILSQIIRKPFILFEYFLTLCPLLTSVMCLISTQSQTHLHYFVFKDFTMRQIVLAHMHHTESHNIIKTQSRGKFSTFPYFVQGPTPYRGSHPVYKSKSFRELRAILNRDSPAWQTRFVWKFKLSPCKAHLHTTFCMEIL